MRKKQKNIMTQPHLLIEEGIRRFYDEKGFCIKEEAFSKLFKISYEKDEEKINEQKRKGGKDVL